MRRNNIFVMVAVFTALTLLAFIACASSSSGGAAAGTAASSGAAAPAAPAAPIAVPTGNNILPAGTDFEGTTGNALPAGFTIWQGTAGTEVATESDAQRGRVLRLTNGGSRNNGIEWRPDSAPVARNATYAIGGWVKVDPSSACAPMVVIGRSVQTSQMTIIPITNVPKDGQWHQFQVEWRYTEALYGIRFIVRNGDPAGSNDFIGGGTTWWDDLYIIRRE